jgi:hypothetical protein
LEKKEKMFLLFIKDLVAIEAVWLNSAGEATPIFTMETF